MCLKNNALSRNFEKIYSIFLLGRKSGKGCYVYTDGNRSVNDEAEKLLEKYRMPLTGR